MLRDGGGEEKMTEEEDEEEGFLTLTDLGERLLILGGCTNVCFTLKGGVPSEGGGGKCLQNIAGYLYKVCR